MNYMICDATLSRLQNPDILKNPDQKLYHLEPENGHLFPDISERTDKLILDVNIDGPKPMKQHPYRISY